MPSGKKNAEDEQVMLITGGNNGIGYHMVRQWLEEGRRVAVLDIETNNLDALKARFVDALLLIVCDVTDEGSMDEAVRRALEAFGGIGVAVHNACVCPFKNLAGHSLDDYRKVMDVNFLGAVALTKAVLPGMLKRNAGKICLTSSGVGVTGFVNISSYASSKGAIEAFAKCMRLEYAGTGVSFHILHPPLTDTKSVEPLPVPKEFKASAQKVGQGLIKRMGSKRFIIAPSFGDAVSIRASYLLPLKMGSLLAKMTARGAKQAAQCQTQP